MSKVALENQLDECLERGVELTALIESGQATEDDLAEAGELQKRHERIKIQLDARRDLLAMGPPRDEPSEPAETIKAMTKGLPAERQTVFRNLGELAQAVARREITGKQSEKLTAYLNQAQATRTGEEGGVLIPPDMSPGFQIIHSGENSLISRTDFLPTSSNHMVVPVEEGVPHDFSAGVRAYWTAELAQATKTRATTTTRIMGLDKLVALVDVSNEEVDDAPLMDALLRVKMPQAIVARTNEALMRGTGVGQPQGVLDSACVIEVAIEAGQTIAAPLLFENTAKMYARFDMSRIGSAAWMINQQLFPSLMGMTVNVKNVAGTDNVGGAPVYVPGGNIAGAPFGTLHGIPVIPSEWCRPIGTPGDIALVGWGAYHTRSKTVQDPASSEIMVSTHILFDRDASQYRLVYRILGFPWYSKPKPPADPANATTSMVVTLAQRS